MNHQQVIELLPWYVNTTLGQQERDRVEAHLRECGECARELEQMRELRQAVRTAGEPIPEPSPFQFTRAMARVEEYEREKSRPRWWQISPRFARVAMAAQFLVILALGSLLFRERLFVTATGVSAGPRIVLGFQAGVTEEIVRQLVQEIHGNIVSGPSALGLYTVETPLKDREALHKLIEELRRNQRVIRIVALAP
jgi:hypothetical protein